MQSVDTEKPLDKSSCVVLWDMGGNQMCWSCTCFHPREVPQELLSLAKGGEVNLNMEDHRHEDYVKPKVTMKAFSGEGHKLGR